MYRAGATSCDAASILRAGQPQIVPKHPEQWRRWIIVKIRHATIDKKRDHTDLPFARLSCSRSAKGMNAAVRTKANGGVPQMAACLSAHVIPGRAISTRSHIRRDSPFVTTTSCDRGCNSALRTAKSENAIVGPSLSRRYRARCCEFTCGDLRTLFPLFTTGRIGADDFSLA